MNKRLHTILLILFAALLFAGCKKGADSPPNRTTPGNILSAEANIVIEPISIAIANDATLLYQGTLQFQATPSEQNLANCRQLWLTTTRDYEQSAAMLFGPFGSLGGDPASIINTYPIDTAAINGIVNSSAAITQDYIDSLPTALAGLHGLEYELYGSNGNKTAGEFTVQQLSYITSLSLSIEILVAQLDSAWNPSSAGNYYYQFVNAGNGSAVYPDQRAAFSDLIMAIANICETDAIYKLNGPFANNNLSLQESPYANNSLEDIKNNIIGVRYIYLGQYGNQTGSGLTVLVSQYNTSLDLEIKNDINNSIKALDAITLPLAQAISSQPTQIHNAMNMCDSLDDVLKNDLQFFVDKYAN